MKPYYEFNRIIWIAPDHRLTTGPATGTDRSGRAG